MLPGFFAEHAVGGGRRYSDRRRASAIDHTFIAQADILGRNTTTIPGDPGPLEASETVHCPGCILWNGVLHCC